MRKKDLAIILSQLSPLSTYSSSLEQYLTDPNIAADMLWTLSLRTSFVGKTVADLGCGHGILGIGALLLGAKKVFFVDVDENALAVALTNLRMVSTHLGKEFSASFVHAAIDCFSRSVDIVIQNPPFGIQKEHADQPFLQASMRCAPLIYSIHKLASDAFLRSFTKSSGYQVHLIDSYDLPLRKTQHYHTKKIYAVAVGLWEISKNADRNI